MKRNILICLVIYVTILYFCQMKRFKLLIFILVASFSTTLAQLDPVYSQYMFNPAIMNPAYAGIYDMASATGVYRNQFLGLNSGGKPETMTFNAHSSLPLDKMGAGITLIRDKVGINTTTSVELLYSYRLILGENRLSFGMNVGFDNYVSDPSQGLNPKSDNDPLYNPDKVSSWNPAFGFGAMYLAENYFVGVSTPSLVKQEISSNGVTNKLQNRHFYATGGYIIKLANELVIKPSVLVRYVSGTVSMDLNGSILMYQNLWAGVSIRNAAEVVVLMAQLQATDALKLGVSMDLASGTIKEIAGGGGVFRPVAYEFMANINFPLLEAHAIQTTLY